MAETWFADGYNLSPAGRDRKIESLIGMGMTPAKKGSLTSRPGITGSTWRARPHGDGRFVLRVWVAGYDRAEALSAYEDMLRACLRTDGLVRFTRVMPDGTSRFADGEVSDTIDPTPLGTGQGYRFSLAVNVPAGYFYDTVSLEQVFSLPRPSVGSGFTYDADLTTFAGGTAPMESLVLNVSGGVRNVRLTAYTRSTASGWVQYTGDIQAGQHIGFDCATWSVSGGLSGWTPNPQGWSYTGPRLLSIPAAPPTQSPRVRVTGVYLGGSPDFEVLGRRAYLC